jgi:hypothetical protein
MTLDGVVKFEAVMPEISSAAARPGSAGRFLTRVAEEDAMLPERHLPGMGGLLAGFDPWTFASHINTVPKYVVSRTWMRSVGIRGAPCSKRSRRRSGAQKQPDKNIGVHGSPMLVGPYCTPTCWTSCGWNLPSGGGQRAPVPKGHRRRTCCWRKPDHRNGVVILTYMTKNNQ